MIGHRLGISVIKFVFMGIRVNTRSFPLFGKLRRNSRLIVLSVAICTFGAGLYEYTQPAEVTVSATIRIGEKPTVLNVGHLEAALNEVISSPESSRFDKATMQDMRVINGMLIEPIEPTPAVLARLNSVILPTIMDDSGVEFELLAAADTRDSRLVRLSANSVDENSAQAQALIQAAAQEITDKHQEIMETHLALESARIADGASIVAANFEAASRPTRTIRKPTVTRYSSTASEPLVIMIGMLMGFLAGITVVVMREFLQQAKQMRTA